jgi:hypothetical protein
MNFRDYTHLRGCLTLKSGLTMSIRAGDTFQGVSPFTFEVAIPGVAPIGWSDYKGKPEDGQGGLHLMVPAFLIDEFIEQHGGAVSHDRHKFQNTASKNAIYQWLYSCEG